VTDQEVDASRRTWLAAERTWLAWWRTGVAVGAVALAVGRIIPGLAHTKRWPFEVVGVGYGLLSVLILLIGASRQHRTAEALHRGRWEELASPLVTRLTAVAIALSVASMVLIAVEL
jgi:putative membrane protein